MNGGAVGLRHSAGDLERRKGLIKLIHIDLDHFILKSGLPIQSAALDLVEEFRGKRIALHVKLVAEAERSGGKMPGYSSANLFCVFREGSMALRWKNVHQIAGRRLYREIPKADQTPRGLRKHAGYAADLVELYERRAQVVRDEWAALMRIKVAGDNMVKRLRPIGVGNQNSAAGAPADKVPTAPSYEGMIPKLNGSQE